MSDGRKPRRSARAYQRCGHDANDAPRERKRACERHRRQQNPVDEQLPEHAPRASTQHETNRDLVAPRQRPRQRQAGKVGARDRQEDSDQRQQHPEPGAVAVAQGRKARRERRHGQPLTGQRLPLGFGQRRRQRRRLHGRPSGEQLRARGFDGHAAGETSDHLFRSGRRRRIAAAGRSHHRERHDEVDTAVGLETAEAVRHDADHRRPCRVELDDLADARSIPEDAPAVRLADHHGVVV